MSQIKIMMVGVMIGLVIAGVVVDIRNRVNDQWGYRLLGGLLCFFALLFFSVTSTAFNGTEAQEQVAPARTVTVLQLETGIYEYPDVWEVGGFYVIPLRRAEGLQQIETENAGTPERRGWHMLAFSTFVKYEIPPSQNAKLVSFTGFLEVKKDGDKKILAVYKPPTSK
ncbi:MAG: hypothetical protein ABI430_01900 [Candidatus Taylorbacteria bacterium]